MEYVFTKTWKLAPWQHLYLKLNSGCHAREDLSEETIYESSQVRELHEANKLLNEEVTCTVY